MLNLSSVWIFLLGLREAFNIFGLPTMFLTIAITGLQFFHMILLLEKEHWHFTYYHIILIFLFLLCGYNVGTLATLNLLFTIILLKKSNITKISFVILVSVFTEFFIYFAGFSLGILKDVVKIYPKGLTHDLGFGNSNTAGLQFCMLLLIVVTFLLQKTKIHFLLYIFLIPNYCIYLLTKGRTYFISGFFFFFLIFYFSFKRKYRIERKIISFLPFLLFSSTYVLIFLFNKNPVLNVLLTGRLALNYETISDFSAINYLLGYGMPEGPMDSSYLGILMNGGIISVLLFLVITSRGLFHMSVKNAKIFIPYIVVMLIASFTETILPLFYPATILFYKILTDQFDFKYVHGKYLKLNSEKN